MKWLNYHHLIYFRFIAVEQSVSKAAQKLGLGQSTLSAQLKLFEEHIGHQLFERQHKKLILTDAGKIALDHANEIFNKGQNFLKVMDSKSLSAKIHVTLGVLDCIPKSLITAMIDKSRHYKEASITILEGKGDYLLRELMRGHIDIFISNYPAPISNTHRVQSRFLLKEPVSVYGALKFKEKKGAFPQGLSHKPFILPTLDSKLRHDIDHYFELHKIYPSIFAQVQDTSVQKQLAIDGMGLVPLPDLSVKRFVKKKQLYKIGSLDQVWEEYWLTRVKRDFENKVVDYIFEKL